VSARAQDTLGALTLSDVMAQKIVPLGISIRASRPATFPGPAPAEGGAGPSGDGVR
jgi:hypothetical protein